MTTVQLPPAWRWMPGMLDSSGCRLAAPATTAFGPDALCGGSPWIAFTRDGIEVRCSPVRPDLTDHGTLGAIEHGLLPEVLGDPNVCLGWREGGFYVYSPRLDECMSSAPTKGVALLLALAEGHERLVELGLKAVPS